MCAVVPAAAAPAGSPRAAGAFGSPRAGACGSPRAGAFGSPRGSGRRLSGAPLPPWGVDKGRLRVRSRRALAVRIPGDPAAVPRAMEASQTRLKERCAFCFKEDSQERLKEVCRCDGGEPSGWAHPECSRRHLRSCVEQGLPRRACGVCQLASKGDTEASGPGSSKEEAFERAEAALKAAWLHVVLKVSTERDRMVLLLWGSEIRGPWAQWVARERMQAGRAPEAWYNIAFPSTTFGGPSTSLLRTKSWKLTALAAMWRRVCSGAASPRDHQTLLTRGADFPGPWSEWVAERQAQQQHPFGRRLLQEEARRLITQRAELESLGRFRRAAPARLSS